MLDHSLSFPVEHPIYTCEGTSAALHPFPHTHDGRVRLATEELLALFVEKVGLFDPLDARLSSGRRVVEQFAARPYSQARHFLPRLGSICFLELRSLLQLVVLGLSGIQGSLSVSM